MEWKWGSFSVTHIASLIIAVLYNILLYFLLKNRSNKTQTVILFLYSLLGPITMIREIIVWAPVQSILRYLPIHLCSVNAILTPVLAITKNKFIGNLTMLFSVTSALALIFNSIQAEYSIMSWEFFLYFTSHAMGCAIPFIMAKLGIIEVKPKYVGRCMLTVFIMYTVVYGINVLINTLAVQYQWYDNLGDLIWVNYMFSVSTQGNPALQFFWDICPYPYFYLLVGGGPIVALYYGIINYKSVIGFFKKKLGKA